MNTYGTDTVTCCLCGTDADGNDTVSLACETMGSAHEDCASEHASHCRECGE